MELRPPNYKILENLIEPNSQKLLRDVSMTIASASDKDLSRKSAPQQHGLRSAASTPAKGRRRRIQRVCIVVTVHELNVYVYIRV